ncbi:MAG TPA: mechanosensitive ion channel family protein [Acidothermaceae bacterium]
MAWRERPVAAAAFADARELIFRPKFRRALVTAVVFVAAAIAGAYDNGVKARHTVNFVLVPDQPHRVFALVAIGVCLVAGIITVQLTANELARLARHRGSPAAASAIRLSVQIVGYLAILVTVLGLFAVKIESVLLSGAIVSVVLGLAAQQSLGNAFAGIVLLISRPFKVGDYITLRAGALGGQYDGQISAISLMFTTMRTKEGPISFPNAAVLSSATGVREDPSGSSPLIT